MKKISVVALACFATLAQANQMVVRDDAKFEVNVELGAYMLSQKSSTGLTSKDMLGGGLNQVEIKATHPISDKVSVFGEIEVDFDPIKDNGSVLTDDVRIGLKNELATFSVGQFDSYYEDNVVEALGVGHADAAILTEPKSANDGRHIQVMKQFGDFTFAGDFTYSKGATSTDTGAAVSGLYKLGDLTVAAGYSDIAAYKTDAASTGTNSDKSSSGIALSYKMGTTALKGMYVITTSTSNVDTRTSGVALTHKMGELDFAVALQNVDVEGAAARNEMLFGVGYTPYKNMTLYVDMTKLDKANNEGDAVEFGVKYAF